MTYSILFTTKKLQMVLEEMGLIALLLAFVLPWLGGSFFARIEAAGRSLVRKRRGAIFAAAAFPMLCRILLLPIFPPPKPVIHDEFSYLLQGDTFAHGRVANPTPPFWRHFETEYVLMDPSYASQYQPLPGVFIALGQKVFGHPWFGVWISTGLMCGTLCWALMGGIPPAWAFFGAILAALQFGIFGFWMNSYYGGSVAATGGALVFGALVRMGPTRKLISLAAICASGIVILMASRPFEGIIWSLIALVIAARLLWKYQFAAAVVRRAALIAFLTLAAGGASLMTYDYHVTGNAFVPPYLQYRLTYGTPQSYWWQPPVLVTNFNNPQLRDNYLDQYRKWEQRNSIGEIADATQKRLRDFWRFFIGPLYTPALLFLPFVIRDDRRIRWWLYASIPFILDHATYHAWYPQQTAPATVLIVLLLVQCWRHMRVWMRQRGRGLAVSRNLTAAMAMVIVLAAVGKAAEPLFPKMPHRMVTWPRIWEMLYQPKRLRDDVTAQLERIPGKHLLFIKYGQDHEFWKEWVFNLADIENQRVVYARSLDPSSDAALADYLSDFDVWYVEPDATPYTLARIRSHRKESVQVAAR